MPSTILVPTDFSPLSRSAFGHALLLAGSEATLRLLHVVEEISEPHPSLWSGQLARLSELMDQQETDARARMAEWTSELTQQLGRPVVGSVERGPVCETIAEHASTHSAKYLVLATHGRGGLSHFLLGSVAERLLRGAPCPVLVARGGSERRPSVKRILVAVDQSEHSGRALKQAVRLAAEHADQEVEVEALHVWAAPFFGEDEALDATLFEKIRDTAQSELSAFIAAQKLPEQVTVRQTIVSGNVNQQLHKVLQERTPDLLVIGTHGRGGFKRWVLGSVAESTVRYAPCAVLVVP